MSEPNIETEPPVAGGDSLTEYLFDPSAGASAAQTVKARHSSPAESHADKARRALDKLSSNRTGDEPSKNG
jgi:succinate dehydrogenase/fumarate reductase flavoprotein subunit